MPVAIVRKPENHGGAQFVRCGTLTLTTLTLTLTLTPTSILARTLAATLILP